MAARIVQLTDTHVVAAGARCHGLDTAAYLRAAVAAIARLDRAPDAVLVTGDLVDGGRQAQYAAFLAAIAPLHVPWFAIPGNHDDPAVFRSALAPANRGDGARGGTTFALDVAAIRILGIDANRAGPSPGAALGDDALAAIDRALAASSRPTLVAVHQPPFRTGLRYLDVFGFAGAERLRAIVDRHPHVGRVVSGHVHCVRHARWRHALALTAPSTAPQMVPHFARVEAEQQEPGFSIHDHDDARGWTTTVVRRGAGDWVATQRL